MTISGLLSLYPHTPYPGGAPLPYPSLPLLGDPGGLWGDAGGAARVAYPGAGMGGPPRGACPGQLLCCCQDPGPSLIGGLMDTPYRSVEGLSRAERNFFAGAANSALGEGATPFAHARA